eukprot:m.253185 g.253185  ORF g.253185 m.253185 type:complete len:1762 (+) comp10996_c0_seq6:72-5357(+)
MRALLLLTVLAALIPAGLGIKFASHPGDVVILAGYKYDVFELSEVYDMLHGAEVMLGSIYIEFDLCDLEVYGDIEFWSGERDDVDDSVTTVKQFLELLFSSIREIHGTFTSHVSSCQCIQSYDFLSNLVVIHGNQLDYHPRLDSRLIGVTDPRRALSLYISGNYHSEGRVEPFDSDACWQAKPNQLGLKSLTLIRQGGVFLFKRPTFANPDVFGICGLIRNPSEHGVDLSLLYPGYSVQNSSAFDLDTNQKYDEPTPAQLSSISSMEWQRVFDDPTRVITYVPSTSVCSNVPEYQSCHPDCNGRCWKFNDPTACQKVCDGSCGEKGCRDGQPNTCCDESCLGGCDAAGQCYVCASGHMQLENGTCVTECPAGMLKFGLYSHFDRDCPEEHKTFIDDPRYCIAPADCPYGYHTTNDSCLWYCPGGYVNDTSQECPPYDGDLRVCETALLSCSSQLPFLGNCEILYGDVLLTKQSDLDSFRVAPQLEIFSTLQLITGYVEIFQTSLKTLHFFRNLKEVKGFLKGRGYYTFGHVEVHTSNVALKITRNDLLTALELRSLTKLGAGSEIRDNINLCLQDTIAFAEIGGPVLLEFTEGYLSTFKEEDDKHLPDLLRGRITHPSCDVVTCNSFCAGRGCWGLTDDMCQVCQDAVLEEGVCVPECSSDYFLRLDYFCTACHESCAECTDEGDRDCTKCHPGQSLLTNGQCADNCPDGQFSLDSICTSCSPLCKTCEGLATNCTECRVQGAQQPRFLLDNECVLSGECGEHKFANPLTGECDECATDCASCVDTAATCTSCTGSLSLKDEACVPDCGNDFFAEDNLCKPCNEGCNVCGSAAKTDCTECNRGYFFVEPTTCVPNEECPPSTVGDPLTSTCVPCGANCEICYLIPGQEPPCFSCEDAKVLNGAVCSDFCPTGFWGEPRDDRSRVCTSCVVCNTEVGPGQQWESQTCNTEHDRICSNCTVCNESQWEKTPCAPTQDTVCLPITPCAADEFQTAPATPTSNTQCQKLKTCDPGYFISKNHTATSDRECQEWRTCDDFSFEIQAPSLFQNRRCQAVQQCDSTTQYITQAHTSTSDRICGECKSCNSTYEEPSGGCNGFVDRSCRLVDRCAVGTVCSNGGTCTSIKGLSTECTCPEEYDGEFCEYWIEGCRINPCNNGGTCQPIINKREFECACTEEWGGRFCNISALPCITNGNPCNNGTCVPDATFGFVCDCGGVYCGDRCELDIVDGVCVGLAASANTSAAAYGAVAAGFGLLLLLIVGYVVARVMHKNKAGPIDDYLELMPRTKPDDWEIERELLTIGKMIGEGHFGSVHKALYMDPVQPEGSPARDVAVKLLKENGKGTQEESDFWSEMKLMKEIGQHPNVISLVGVCTLDEPLLLVVEFADHGDLKGYLRDRRPTPTRPALVTQEELFIFCLQIAHGMEYLSMLKVIHRDLAIRNVLVCAGGVMKVSDFGLARDVYEEDFYQKTTAGKMPFKWMAPEALLDRVFTTASDVWSFGIVMWEILTLGNAPYPTITNQGLLDELKNGYRMEMPPLFCTNAVYQVMLKCWEYYPSERPTFTEVKAMLFDATGIDPSTIGPQIRPRNDTDAYENPGFDEGNYQEPIGDNAYLAPELYDTRDGVPVRKISRRRSAELREFKPVTIRGASAGTADNVYDMGGEDNNDNVYDMGAELPDAATATAAAPLSSAPSLKPTAHSLFKPSGATAAQENVYDMGEGATSQPVYDMGEPIERAQPVYDMGEPIEQGQAVYDEADSTNLPGAVQP